MPVTRYTVKIEGQSDYTAGIGPEGEASAWNRAQSTLKEAERYGHQCPKVTIIPETVYTKRELARRGAREPNGDPSVRAATLGILNPPQHR